MRCSDMRGYGATAHLTLILAAAFLSSACAGRTVPLNAPNADSRTGEMVVFLREPIVLQRRAPYLSAHGRDFVYLAPVSTNRQGVGKVYLWVGVASTVDRDMNKTAPLQASNLHFPLGGDGLTVPLLDWHESTPPAPKSGVSIARSLRTLLTLADYDRLVRAEPGSVTLLDGDERVGEFALWSGSWDAWRNLDDDTAVGLGVEVRVAGNVK